MPYDERSIIWEVIISVILSKKMYIFMCPIPNGFRDRAISLYTVQRYYVLFLTPVFIVQATKLVQFSYYSNIFKNSTVNISAF
jgi:hypothetical protein